MKLILVTKLYKKQKYKSRRKTDGRDSDYNNESCKLNLEV